MSNWLKREKEQQLGDDLAQIIINLTRIVWHLVKRYYREAQQPPKQQP